MSLFNIGLKDRELELLESLVAAIKSISDGNRQVVVRLTVEDRDSHELLQKAGQKFVTGKNGVTNEKSHSRSYAKKGS